MTRWLFLAALSTACAAAEPNVSQLVGPDGSRVYHVSCQRSEAHCFQLAGEACPFGYDYAATPQRNLLVRCKGAMAPNPYLAFSDPPRPLEERNPYIDRKLLPNPYTAPTAPPSTEPVPTIPAVPPAPSVPPLR